MVEDEELDLDIDLDEDDDETEEERAARAELEIDLDEEGLEFVAFLVDKLMLMAERFSGHKWYNYQRPFAMRIFESVIIEDGETLTALYCRQCVDGDTIVFRRDGTAVRIRNHENAVLTGTMPVKRYKFKGGYELVMTDEHPVVRKDEFGGSWTAAGMLEVGDKVSVMNGWDQWEKRSFVHRIIKVGRHGNAREVKFPVTNELARFLGYLTTDGSMRPGQSAKFTNINPDYLQEVSDLSQSLFGITPKRYAKGKGADLLFTTSKSSYDNRLLDVMHAIEWDHGFPLDVFAWSPDEVSEFINRAWSGDGCITMKSSGPEIFLACGNDEIYAKFWQSLLFKLGITSTVKREHVSKGTGTFHRLVLGNGAKNTKRFFQAVGLVYGKEAQCLKAIDYFVTKALLPSGKGRAERNMYEYAGQGMDEEELVWTKLLSIEDAGVIDVYDMEVPEKKWYTANGIQVSNSGKSETVANCIATCMIMLPVLARIYPFWLERFKEGVWVGAFAPVDGQADTLFTRIVGVLEGDAAAEVYSDPDFSASLYSRGKVKGVKFQGMLKGSLVRKTTCHPRATIEGDTYHIILIDEAQGASDQVVNKSIEPMGTSTGATMIFTGTCTYNKNVFYNQIQVNKRKVNQRGRTRQCHFEVDWKRVARENKRYGRAVKKAMLRIGEDSDEFKLSYRLMWLLDRGMFTTSDKLDKCGDKTMELVHSWTKTPVIVGIDPARIQDKTVVTVVFVDWDHPDDLGYYGHCILNWLDLEGLDWEIQYHKIVDFLSNYNVWKVGVDSGGVGDAVAQRLQLLMPHTEVVPLGSAATEQSVRWKYLRALIDREQLSWPAHSKVKKLKVWKRFRQEMEDLEISFKGPHMQAEAPHVRDAHDDFADSASMACILSQTKKESTVEVYENPFFTRSPMY